MVAVLHLVLQLPSSRCAWCHRCCRRAVVVSPLWSLRHMGVAVGVFALHVVLQLRSLRHVGVAVAVVVPCVVSRVLSLCHGHCTMWVLWSAFLRYMWYCGHCCTALVLRVPSLHHAWCCGCHRCTMYGVVGAITVPHVVLRVPLLHCVWCHRWCRRAMMVSQSWSLCHMWCCSCYHHTVPGVVDAVIVPHLVSQMLLSCCAWCCRCCCHAAVVS